MIRMWQAALVAALFVMGCAAQTQDGNSIGIGQDSINENGANDGGPGDLCGNGELDEGELCDVAIPVPLDGCCPFPELCVDDDPCTVDRLVNDGTCSADCDFTETVGPSGDALDQCCPDGATNATDADCSPDMTEPECGDSNLDDGEECDDGNTADGDGCSANCTVEPTIPGPGTKTQGVACSILGAINATLPVDITATPLTPVVAGQPFDVEISASVALSEFLAGFINSQIGASIDVTAATLNLQARAGATGTPTISPTVPFVIDVSIDTDNNGMPGPTPINAGTGTVTFVADANATEALIEVASVSVTVDVLGGTTLDCPGGRWTVGPNPSFGVPPALPLSDADALVIPIN